MKRKLLYKECILSPKESNILSELASNALKKFNDINSSKFLKNCYHYTASLPTKIRESILSFKNNSCDCLIISGLDFDNNVVESTPQHWNTPKQKYTRFLQFIHFIIASNIGYPYGWKTQQDGSLVSDVLPIPGYEEYQQGFGSVGGLRFHTEDPFHIARADFFTLMCMRNLDNTPTTLFPLDLTKIPEDIKEELFKNQFQIIPDESHTRLTYTNGINKENVEVFKSFNIIRKISILYGNKINPYLRIDPEIMKLEGLTSKAEAAYKYICEAIENARNEIVLKPGQIIAINNHRLAHGRGSFKAKYDGSDRWLERILTLEDIRKTVDYRCSEFEYIITR